MIRLTGTEIINPTPCAKGTKNLLKIRNQPHKCLVNMALRALVKVLFDIQDPRGTLHYTLLKTGFLQIEAGIDKILHQRIEHEAKGLRPSSSTTVPRRDGKKV